jgi:polysaccharide biosynthesis protein PelD
VAAGASEDMGRKLLSWRDRLSVASVLGQDWQGAGLPVLPPGNALVELLVLLVVPILLEWLLPTFPDLTQIQPHPYWFPILLLSLQYGTVSGFLAAIVAIIGAWLIGWPEQDIGENHFQYLVRIWTLPVLWIGTALILGQFRMRQIMQKIELQRQVEELKRDQATLAGYANRMRLRCDELERSMTARATPDAVRLVDALAALRSAKVSNIEATFRQCMHALLPEGQASLFVANGDGLTLVASFGWPRNARWGRSLDASAPLTRAVLRDMRAVSALHPGDELVLAGEGLIAVPAMLPGRTEIVGMLKAEDLDPGNFIPATVGRLEVLAAAFAEVLADCAHGRLTPVYEHRRSVHDVVPRVRPWRQMRWSPGSAALTKKPTGPR